MTTVLVKLRAFIILTSQKRYPGHAAIMTGEMREHILAEIRRLAASTGKVPGKLVFARETGIREHQWSGVLWARWSDALAAAGFEKNCLQGRFATEDVLLKIVEACRYYGRVPSSSELKLYRVENPSFPSHNTVTNHFPTKALLLKALVQYSNKACEYSDIASMLPELTDFGQGRLSISKKKEEGSVYLLRSGLHYKIGRSDELERRVKEIRIALPEAVTLVHTIRTDDPSGIETYWHRRFADRRANGEWFELRPNDVTAFKKRKYQ